MNQVGTQVERNALASGISQTFERLKESTNYKGNAIWWLLLSSINELQKDKAKLSMLSTVEEDFLSRIWRKFYLMSESRKS